MATMITEALTRTFRAVEQQDYEPAYIFQVIPVVGPIISVPTALFSGAMAVVKAVQSLFQKVGYGTPFFRSDEDERRYIPLEDAIDLSIIFANNVINICTCGILNNFFVFHVLTSINCGNEYD
ncbi:MAG: hypothetical protein H0T62_04450 [Parachlamydiaceae bacterium]|nr:hypothetical protein [Parachlamydiaceae bacterium]